MTEITVRQHAVKPEFIAPWLHGLMCSRSPGHWGFDALWPIAQREADAAPDDALTCTSVVLVWTPDDCHVLWKRDGA